mgnify:CR=1 FL=1
MSWARFLQDARREVEPYIGEAIRHRRDHPGIYAMANAMAAAYHRARGHRVRAVWHRMWRRRYARLAAATAEHQECAMMLRRRDA